MTRNIDEPMACGDGDNVVAPEDFERLVELCENPPPANDALKALMREGQKLVKK